MRKLSDLVSEGFIQGVGITRPQPGQERRAAIYITTLLALTIAGAFALVFFAVHHLG